MNWPATLPHSLLIRGYTEQPLDVLLRNAYNGRPRARNLFTNPPLLVSGVQIIDADQKEDLENFFRITTQNGAIRFLWRRPRKLVDEYFEFAQSPSYTALSCDQFEVALSFTVFTEA